MSCPLFDTPEGVAKLSGMSFASTVQECTESGAVKNYSLRQPPEAARSVLDRISRARATSVSDRK